MTKLKNVLKVAAMFGTVAVFATQPAMADAILTGADITSATSSSGADESLKAGALWAIGLTVAVVAVAKVIGLIKK